MARMNFQETLEKKLGDVERPPLIPQGTYVAAVSKQPTFDSVGADGQWETCDFIMKLLSPTDDVDADELKEYGDLSAAYIRHRFMFNTGEGEAAAFQRTEYNLKRFLEDHLQIDGAAKKGYKQALAESVNHQCLVVISWRPDKNDPEIMYAEVRATAPIE